MLIVYLIIIDTTSTNNIIILIIQILQFANIIIILYESYEKFYLVKNYKGN